MTFNDQTELFTHAVTEIFRQGERSVLGDICQYRLNGLKCIAGHCIDDADYVPEMEDSGCNLIKNVVDKFKLDYLKPYVPLLQELQDVHDNYHPIRWVVEFQRVADQFEIKVSVQDLSQQCTWV